MTSHIFSAAFVVLSSLFQAKPLSPDCFFPFCRRTRRSSNQRSASAPQRPEKPTGHSLEEGKNRTSKENMLICFFFFLTNSISCICYFQGCCSLSCVNGNHPSNKDQQGDAIASQQRYQILRFRIFSAKKTFQQKFF